MENFKLSIDMLKLRNAVLTTSSRGTNLLVINLDDSEGFRIYKREGGDDSVYLNLKATVSRDQSKSSHFLSPNIQYDKGSYPPSCGYVQQYASNSDQDTPVQKHNSNNYGKEAEDMTAEDLPF